MRDELRKRNGEVITLVGKFDKYGKKEGDTATWNTVLLTNVCFESGTPACDHLWFVAQKQFLNTLMMKDSIVQVTGVVHNYSRHNGSVDYGMPEAKVKVLKQGTKIIPCKIWNANGFRYMKFITYLGTRWFRINKSGNIERVTLKFNGKDFDEMVTEFDDYDKSTLLDVIRYL